MNTEPAWPCSDTSISELLNITNNSETAVRGLESMLCMNGSFYDEWEQYVHAQKVKMFVSIYNPSISIHKHIPIRH